MRLPPYPDISHFSVMPQAIERNAVFGVNVLFRVSMSSSKRTFLEALTWIIGLSAVGFADPTAPSAIDLCLFKAIGLNGCPGCGLGQAMGYLFRGEWLLAIQTHWFSPVVLGILLTRIAQLLRQSFSERSLL
jgi:hypothetical protein